MKRLWALQRLSRYSDVRHSFSGADDKTGASHRVVFKLLLPVRREVAARSSRGCT